MAAWFKDKHIIVTVVRSGWQILSFLTNPKITVRACCFSKAVGGLLALTVSQNRRTVRLKVPPVGLT